MPLFPLLRVVNKTLNFSDLSIVFRRVQRRVRGVVLSVGVIVALDGISVLCKVDLVQFRPPPVSTLGMSEGAFSLIIKRVLQEFRW